MDNERRWTVDVNKNEITRFYRITDSNKCEVISAIVPRTSKGFLEDLYPNTLGLVPALSAEAWFIGEDGMPILVLDET
jgi:coronin-1B/1C/6